MKKVWIIIAASMLKACASGEETEQVHVMAAASLSDALGDIEEIYEEEEHVELIMNYGSSGQLRQQIVQGAPVDVFISAAESDMEMLVDRGEVSETTSLLRNRLQLISTLEMEIADWSDLMTVDFQGLAVGHPESVPAGKYAAQVLENMNLHTELEDQFVYGQDVRQVLTYVETGNADVGIVYQTDALSTEDVQSVALAPEDFHEPIVYPIGLIGDVSERAEHFYDWVQTDEPLHIFESYGFEIGVQHD
ncbi:molybdate ABC transporter substrate-binding protein [Geomicrobium sp. JSM 1781026]|uniref:molybdate ABC transporter substrate-binding protein n=1 Tax=Geomicrobium sp. JSM 1781026 TaxID=3344580 RepID=UPI0035C097F7